LFIGCERSVPPRARVNDHAAELNGQIGGRTVSWFGRMRREAGKLDFAIYTDSNAAKELHRRDDDQPKSRDHQQKRAYASRRASGVSNVAPQDRKALREWVEFPAADGNFEGFMKSLPRTAR
jgi:hypothetical protein